MVFFAAGAGVFFAAAAGAAFPAVTLAGRALFTTVFGAGRAFLAGAFEAFFGATCELGRCLAIGRDLRSHLATDDLATVYWTQPMVNCPSGQLPSEFGTSGAALR
ncbi:MAG: hypothetical protein EHM24_18380 [Acidobacteria bacterium]|nr:MAG: hypothetical protein EHM24_18380 [Acidobacteriota bacterium]